MTIPALARLNSVALSQKPSLSLQCALQHTGLRAIPGNPRRRGDVARRHTGKTAQDARHGVDDRRRQRPLELSERQDLLSDPLQNALSHCVHLAVLHRGGQGYGRVGLGRHSGRGRGVRDGHTRDVDRCATRADGSSRCVPRDRIIDCQSLIVAYAGPCWAWKVA